MISNLNSTWFTDRFLLWDAHGLGTSLHQLSREKAFVGIGEKYDFRGENFHRLLTFAAPKDATPLNFAEKLSWIATKLWNSQKVFSLKGFPLYGSNLLS